MLTQFLFQKGNEILSHRQPCQCHPYQYHYDYCVTCHGVFHSDDETYDYFKRNLLLAKEMPENYITRAAWEIKRTVSVKSHSVNRPTATDVSLIRKHIDLHTHIERAKCRKKLQQQLFTIIVHSRTLSQLRIIKL